MDIRVIKSNEEHAAYLEEAEALVMQDPEPGTAEADRLELLFLVIEAFERTNFPIELPTPLEAILFRMEEQGLHQRDLVPFIGSKSKVSEVLSGKRKLSINMIRELNHGLGIPVKVLIGKYELGKTSDLALKS
jgi:HTH-type transcriptional regulator/antitoxin HigA